MSEVWPAELQQCLNAESFSFSKGDTKIRSDVDIGAPKVRSRLTKGVDIMSVSINCTVDEEQILDDFYTVILNNGTTQFEFLHPIKKTTILVRFIGAYNITPLGSGIMFSVSMQWEILPA